MRGYVEIILQKENGEEIPIESGPNLIVDGMRETLVNAMCVPPALSAIASASALLDVSNYTVNAVSFGKDPSSYLFNAHGTHPITVSGREQFNPPRVYVVNNNSTSSYFPINGLPSYPDPLDRLLQVIPSSVSSLIVQYGQNLNIIPYWSALSAVSSIGASGAYAIGTYPINATGTNRTIGAIYSSSTSALITSARFTSDSYNSSFSAMDWRGFLNVARTGAVLQGVVTSSVFATLDTVGEVIYKIRIGADELGFTNFYGGITLMGLWGIDLEASLARGNSPPYQFNQINNPIEYKLLAKKSFTQNLAAIQDTGGVAGIQSYNVLTILWRLWFV